MARADRQIFFGLPFWLGLLACTVFFCLNITGFGLTHFPGDLGDARFNNYLLEHACRFFAGQEKEFWNAGFMFPEKNVITYSDNLLGTAPVYGLFRVAGASPELSFQLWFIAVTLLNFAACYLFLRWLFKNEGAAAAGAFVFACSVALQSQMPHAQTFSRFAVPLVFWMALRFVEQMNPKHFLYMLLFFVYQVYCGIYLGLLLLTPLALLLLFSVILFRKKFSQVVRSRSWWLRITASVLLAGSLLLPLLLPYLERAREGGYHAIESVMGSVPEIISRVYTKEGTLFWRVLDKLNYDHPSWWDDQIFPGGVALLSFVAAVILVITHSHRPLPGSEGRHRMLLLIMLTAISSIVLFTRSGQSSLYSVLYHLIPGYPSMRALQRIINIELVFYAVAVSFVYVILSRLVNKQFVFFFIFLVLLVADNFLIAEYTDCTTVEESRQRVAKVARRYDHRSPGVVISYEPRVLSPNVIHDHLDAMLAAQQLGVKTLNGYSSTSPADYDVYWVRPDSLSRSKWLKLRGVDPSSIQVIR